MPDRLFSRCLSWNQRGNTARVRWLLMLAAFVVSLAALTFSTACNPGFNTPPPIGGDAVIYDSLGWELFNGRGFSLNFRDPGFLEPYRQADPAGAERLAQSGPHGPIASRPPLLPLLLAGLNRALGRQFFGLRAINVLAMATVAAMLVGTVARLAGPIPALIALVNFLIVDPRIRVTAREFLTEALACLLIGGLTALLTSFDRRPRLKTAVISGVILGLAMLFRTMFVFWIPLLAVWLCIVSTDANFSRARRVLLSASFVIAAILVFAPWGVRNCHVLGRIMPLGSQGTIELSAGYSDAAFDRLGMWHNLEESGFFAAIDQPGQTELQKELGRADHSRNRAFAWCASHPLKAAVLPLMKVFQEFRPHMSGDLFILAFALLGLCTVRGTAESRAWRAMLLATALGVAVTWSVAGRFIVPILYVLHCAAATGLWQSLLACAGVQLRAAGR